MRNKILAVCLAYLLAGNLFAQSPGQSSALRTVTTTPTTCTVGSGSVVVYAGNLYVCGSDGLYHQPGAGAVSIDVNQCIALAGGNDSNDGRTYSTAKATITGCLTGLPSGSAGVYGNGTVWVGPGVALNAAGAVYGLWLMGPNDPNYASPPTGWQNRPEVLSTLSAFQTGTVAQTRTNPKLG